MNTGLPGSCTTDCKMFVPLATCGNGHLDPGEQCDDGAQNGAVGDKCDAHCHFKCGNGVKDPGEQCDDGVNNGAYNTCNPNCTLPGYCGDGIKNGPEQCDNGASNVSPGHRLRARHLHHRLHLRPLHCGDGRTETQFGEQCDGQADCSPSSCRASSRRTRDRSLSGRARPRPLDPPPVGPR